MKKKIGILTLYFNNYNYGGLLQAYALPKALQKMGYEAEQICFNNKKSENPLKEFEYTKKDKIIQYGFTYIFFVVKIFTKKLIAKFLLFKKDPSYSKENIQSRNIRFKEFEQVSVDHSESIYDYTSISAANEKYDAFICGSDQIWNPLLIRDEYLLKFVKNEKIKIAYAASIARANLNKWETRYIIDAIKDFKAVSLREKSSIMALSNCKNELPITNMPDPTFLLSKDDWDDLLKKNEIKTEYNNYIFCYLLGNNILQRKIVLRYAKKTGKKIVYFPHVLGKFRAEDVNFSCIPQYACGPDEFISLIKNADIVITDSFHAIVFSLIYQKKFVAFKRDKDSFENDMISRISDLLESVGLSNFLINNSFTELCHSQGKIYNFKKANDWIESERGRAYAFLRDALNK